MYVRMYGYLRWIWYIRENEGSVGEDILKDDFILRVGIWRKVKHGRKEQRARRKRLEKGTLAIFNY